MTAHHGGTQSYWVEHAHLPTGLAKGVRIVVAGERLLHVVPGTHPHRSDERLHGVALPGFANAHSHTFHRALRGRTHADGGTFWTWREQMYALTARLDPSTYHALARAVFAEMLLAGMTVVGEFHYLHHDPAGRPYADPNAMGEALVAAADEAGIRLTLLDTCYLTGGLSGDGHVPLNHNQRRFSDGSVDAWAERVAALSDTPTVRIGAAAHSVRAVPRDDLKALGAVVGDKPVHIHLSEQPAENLACQSHYGLTPTGLLEETGLLGPSTTGVHATHLTDADIALLGDSGTAACFCPTTERDLADGIGRARDLADAGVPLCLGSDQQAVIDPFEDVRGLEMHERLVTHERGRFTPEELGAIASFGGYRSLGWDEGGELRAGALADFVVVREDTINTLGTKPGQILYSAHACDVSDVVVGGRRVVRDSEHVLGSVASMLGQALMNLREKPEPR